MVSKYILDPAECGVDFHIMPPARRNTRPCFDITLPGPAYNARMMQEVFMTALADTGHMFPASIANPQEDRSEEKAFADSLAGKT